MTNTSLLMVGCGKMGSALLGGFLEKGLDPSSVTIIEPAGGEALKKELKVEVVASFEELSGDYHPDMILFAVKPQVLPDVLPLYAKWGNSHTLMMSVAAGTLIETFTHHLGEQSPIVRLMPNLPALVGAGVTGACCNSHVSGEQKDKVTHLLASVGEIVWVDEEQQMNAITAISGSGPAYIFHFIEALTEAGTALGLPEETAKTLAYHTVYGSAKMAVESSKSATDLRVQVTSPNGTTAAALDVFMQNDALKELVKQATNAAKSRSIELSK